MMMEMWMIQNDNLCNGQCMADGECDKEAI